MWRSICLVMKKKISARSDVVWPFKKIICQNRINKIGQIQPKCLRNYAWKMMMWHIVLKIKSVFLMLWRSMCLVMKKTISARSDVVWHFKKISAKIASKLYFRKNWGVKSAFSHDVHKIVRKSTFHILYITLYINLFKIHCFLFFNKILY